MDVRLASVQTADFGSDAFDQGCHQPVVCGNGHAILHPMQPVLMTDPESILEAA
jgi:hypothetical protein